MPDACPRDPLETWTHVAAGWAVVCVAIALISGALAARLEIAAHRGSDLRGPFEARLEQSYLALMLVGAFILLNLAFTYWEPQAHTKDGSVGRAGLIALVILSVIGFKALCTGLARWRRRALLDAAEGGKGHDGTWVRSGAAGSADRL